MKIKEYFKILQEIFSLLDESKVEELANLIKTAGKNNKFIYIFGNGGSGANASHFTQDLLKCPIKNFFSQEGRYKAICLNDNIPVIMAYANDLSYEEVFLQQLMNFCTSGDLVIGLSGSGNSKNVIKAIEFGNRVGSKTFVITGFDGGSLLKSSNNSLHIQTNNMQAYEDVCMAVLHATISFLKI